MKWRFSYKIESYEGEKDFGSFSVRDMVAWTRTQVPFAYGFVELAGGTVQVNGQDVGTYKIVKMPEEETND